TWVALPAQTPRLTWEPSDASLNQPISLAAEVAAAWVEQDDTVFLLQGTAFIKQGLIVCRAENALVRVDTAALKKTGNNRLEIYAEGSVQVQDGAQNIHGDQTLPQALFVLNTSAEVKVNGYDGQVIQRPHYNDPVFQR